LGQLEAVSIYSLANEKVDLMTADAGEADVNGGAAGEMDDSPIRAAGPASAAEPIAGGRTAPLVPSKQRQRSASASEGAILTAV
jgi:hypothetical protein